MTARTRTAPMPQADTRSATRHRRRGGGTGGRGRRAATSISSVQPVDGPTNGGSVNELTLNVLAQRVAPARVRANRYSPRRRPS